MRGLDGNYINTQGDVLTRMQVIYQAEQYRQQIRAQLEAADTLKKLREEVEQTEKKDHSNSPRQVGDDMGSGRRRTNERETTEKKPTQNQEEGKPDHEDFITINHIDVRA
jgi:hypothetical protein